MSGDLPEYITSDVYLKLLQFGRERSLNGFSDDDVHDFAVDVGIFTKAERDPEEITKNSRIQKKINRLADLGF